MLITPRGGGRCCLEFYLRGAFEDLTFAVLRSSRVLWVPCSTFMKNRQTVLSCDPDRSAADRSESNLKPFRVFYQAVNRWV